MFRSKLQCDIVIKCNIIFIVVYPNHWNPKINSYTACKLCYVNLVQLQSCDVIVAMCSSAMKLSAVTSQHGEMSTYEWR